MNPKKKPSSFDSDNTGFPQTGIIMIPVRVASVLTCFKTKHHLVHVGPISCHISPFPNADSLKPRM
ncbi:unnamed protein product [Rhodiola kirilowii]